MKTVPTHSEATGGGDDTSNCDACGFETDGHTARECFEAGKSVGALDQDIARTSQLAEALGIEYRGQSWDSLICLVDKACSLLVNRETAERIGHEVKEDFQAALRATQEMSAKLDSIYQVRRS